LPYDCVHAVISEGAEYCYVIAKRRIRRAPVHRLLPLITKFPCSELIYCSAPKILARHLERIKLGILRRQRTGVLVADGHLFPLSTTRGVKLRKETLYRAASLDPLELDKLYSEIIVLPF